MLYTITCFWRPKCSLECSPGSRRVIYNCIFLTQTCSLGSRRVIYNYIFMTRKCSLLSRRVIYNYNFWNIFGPTTFANCYCISHPGCQNEGPPEANCYWKVLIARRCDCRQPAFHRSGTRTPQPSREVSSGRVDPTSLKQLHFYDEKMQSFISPCYIQLQFLEHFWTSDFC